MKLQSRRFIRQLATSAAMVVPLFTATYYSAYLLRFAGEPTQWLRELFLPTLAWLLIIKLSAFAWFRLHRLWKRIVSFHDVILYGQAITCGSLGLMIFDFMCLPAISIPRSIILIDWGATVLLMCALRAMPRLLHSDLWQWVTASQGTVSFIVGANETGETLLRAIRFNSSPTHRVIGFIDDRPELQGCRIGGLSVLGACDHLPQLVERYGADEVLITSGELTGKQVRHLVELGRQHAFRVKVLPSYEQLLNENVAVHPRAVAIEDLLCRSSVSLDLDGVSDWLAGKTIMVTGSAGSIGSEICRQLVRLGTARIVLVDRSETGQFFLERELLQIQESSEFWPLQSRRDFALKEGHTPWGAHASRPAATHIDTRLADLTDRSRVQALFEETRPDIVFHAAAYKHVPLMEQHCGEAVKNIVLATRCLVDLADEYESQALVMISTDKAVNPTSVMGSCKRLAEQYVQARSTCSGCRFVTVRFGNVLDSSGSVVPIFRQQIAAGGPLTVTHPDMTRYFMLIPEAAQLVVQAGAMGQGGEIFVLDMGEPVRIMDLAHDMVRLSGLRVGQDIEIKVTGLRPGEKLYEELYDDRESHQLTSHPKIMVAPSTPRNLLEVIHDIGRLEEVVDEPNEHVRAALREIIPLSGPAAGSSRFRAAA